MLPSTLPFIFKMFARESYISTLHLFWFSTHLFVNLFVFIFKKVTDVHIATISQSNISSDNDVFMWRYTNTFQRHTWRLVACPVWLGKCVFMRHCIYEPNWTMWEALIGKNKLNLNPLRKTTNIWARKWKRCSGTSFPSQETGFLMDKHFLFHVFPTIEWNNRGRQLDWYASPAGSGFPFQLSKHTSNYFHHSKKWMIRHTVFFAVPSLVFSIIPILHLSNFDLCSTYFLYS